MYCNFFCWTQQNLEDRDGSKNVTFWIQGPKYWYCCVLFFKYLWFFSWFFLLFLSCFLYFVTALEYNYPTIKSWFNGRKLGFCNRALVFILFFYNTVIPWIRLRSNKALIWVKSSFWLFSYAFLTRYNLTSESISRNYDFFKWILYTNIANHVFEYAFLLCLLKK